MPQAPCEGGTSAPWAARSDVVQWAHFVVGGVAAVMRLTPTAARPSWIAGPGPAACLVSGEGLYHTASDVGLGPLVRVVIPVYNRAASVLEAVRSACGQTLTDIEVLVADDGSTDETAEMVNEFCAIDSRVRLIRLQHRGASTARNAALQAAGRYEYVAFLDSDDLWLPAHLERAVRALKANPGAGACFSGSTIEVVGGVLSPRDLSAQLEMLATPPAMADERLEDGFHLLSAETCRRAFIMNRFVPMTPTVVVRRRAVARAPWFNPDLVVMEDSDLFLFLAETGHSFVFDEQADVRIRRLGDNPPGALSQDGMERWLLSVLGYHFGKLRSCRSHTERAFVNDEIRGIARQLGDYTACSNSSVIGSCEPS